MWASIAPDLLPFFKFIPHYKEESIHYVARQIVDLIYLSQRHNLEDQDQFLNKYFSKKLGVVSHYLADYTCYPHSRRIRCTSGKNSRDHIQYEKSLNTYLKDHDFRQVPLESLDLDIMSYRKMLGQVKDYISAAIESYEKQETTYANDLNYALTLNKRVTDGILTCVDPLVETAIQAKKSSLITIWWAFSKLRRQVCRTTQIANI